MLRIAACVLVLVPGVAFSAGEVEYFSAAYTNGTIRLDWKLSARQQADFEIYRKRPDEGSYSKQADIPYNGTDVYTYVDDNLFKAQAGAQISFSYKLVVHQGGQVQNYLASVDNGPTAVQRSWGSIKLMFR